MICAVFLNISLKIKDRLHGLDKLDKIMMFKCL